MPSIGVGGRLLTMARRTSAGELYYRVGLEARVEENPDSPFDYGNTESEFREQFACRAAYVHLRGGEDVMASRLQGHHVQVIRVRSAASTRTITTDWRVRDKTTDELFNIRDITRDVGRQFIDLLCEKGVAT